MNNNQRKRSRSKGKGGDNNSDHDSYSFLGDLEDNSHNQHHEGNDDNNGMNSSAPSIENDIVISSELLALELRNHIEKPSEYDHSIASVAKYLFFYNAPASKHGLDHTSNDKTKTSKNRIHQSSSNADDTASENGSEDDNNDQKQNQHQKQQEDFEDDVVLIELSGIKDHFKQSTKRIANRGNTEQSSAAATTITTDVALYNGTGSSSSSKAVATRRTSNRVRNLSPIKNGKSVEGNNINDAIENMIESESVKPNVGKKYQITVSDIVLRYPDEDYLLEEQTFNGEIIDEIKIRDTAIVLKLNPDQIVRFGSLMWQNFPNVKNFQHLQRKIPEFYNLKPLHLIEFYYVFWKYSRIYYKVHDSKIASKKISTANGNDTDDEIVIDVSDNGNQRNLAPYTMKDILTYGQGLLQSGMNVLQLRVNNFQIYMNLNENGEIEFEEQVFPDPIQFFDYFKKAKSPDHEIIDDAWEVIYYRQHSLKILRDALENICVPSVKAHQRQKIHQDPKFQLDQVVVEEEDDDVVLDYGQGHVEF